MVPIMRMAAALAILAGMALPAGARERACGWYVILGCSPEAYEAEKVLEEVRGIVLPGSSGTHIVETVDYPNFNPGLFCVVDGPFGSEIRAGNVHWPDMVPEAYVKRGC